MAGEPDTTWPLDDQIAELKRELAIRKSVYPKWIKNARMTRDNAAVYWGRMRSALHTLIALDQFGRIVESEFTGEGPPSRVKVEFDGKSAWYGRETNDG